MEWPFQKLDFVDFGEFYVDLDECYGSLSYWKIFITLTVYMAFQVCSYFDIHCLTHFIRHYNLALVEDLASWEYTLAIIFFI